MKNSITIGFIAFWVLASSAVFGTQQAPDKIIYNGKVYFSPYIYPLESYFEKYPDKHPTKYQNTLSSLRRGYIATFEINNNQLYLKDIEIIIDDTIVENGRYKMKWKSVLNEVFPNQDVIKIDWFTGLLDLWDSMCYTIYNYNIILEIDKGYIIKEKLLKNKEEYKKFEEEQFKAFLKTKEYKKVKRKLKMVGRDSFLQRFIIKYSSKILVEDDEK